MERPYQLDFDYSENVSTKRTYKEYTNIPEKRHCKDKHNKCNKCNKRKLSVSEKNEDLNSHEKKFQITRA